jgi:hypothetical protein
VATPLSPPESQYCPRCHAVVKERDVFCPECGCDLKRPLWVKRARDQLARELKISRAQNALKRRGIFGIVLIVLGVVIFSVIYWEQVNNRVQSFGDPRILLGVILGILGVVLGVLMVVAATHLRNRLERTEEILE